MATYAFVNLIVMIVIFLVLRVWRQRFSSAFWVTMGAILFMTAVFDSVLVGLSIVAYDMNRISGLMIGYAPIEDFCYAVIAVVVVPLLWQRFGGRYVDDI